MTLLLSLLSILFAVTAAFLPMLPAFFPILGLTPIYRMRPLRGVLIAAAWVLATVILINKPGSYLHIPFVLIFSIPVFLLEPQRVFVSLDDPEHISASEADIQENALVIGYDDNDHAAAWQFEVLKPRHLINDHIGGEPLLVAY